MVLKFADIIGMVDSRSYSEQGIELREQNRRLRLEIFDHKARLAALEREKKWLEREQDILKQEHELLKREQEQQKEARERLERENAGLKAELARARMTSQNSSKRPSSDIVKPRRERRDSTRKIGGQPGHPLHERAPFNPDELDAVIVHTLSCCPDCQGPLAFCDSVTQTVQQMEIQPAPVRVEEHRASTYWCARCQKHHAAPLPPHVEKGGLCGPYLTTLIAYMKGACHASFSTIRKYLRDTTGIRVSRGLLAKLIAKVSAALEGSYEELLKLLPKQKRLNVDETGHSEKGARLWTWCFRAELFVLFKIDESRGSKVLLEVLGDEFNGTLGCDYFSAYRKYMGDFGVKVQFCLAHLIRDVKFLLTLKDAPTKAYGEKLLAGLRELFGVIHQREALSAEAFKRQLSAARAWILFEARTNVPSSREAQNLANRFRKHGEAYFRFITTPGVEPTNNLAEQAIRFVVIDRLVTQGTRSEKGRRWCERIWTALATCTLRDTSVYGFLHKTILAYFNGGKPPSLLPITT